MKKAVAEAGPEEASQKVFIFLTIGQWYASNREIVNQECIRRKSGAYGAEDLLNGLMQRWENGEYVANDVLKKYRIIYSCVVEGSSEEAIAGREFFKDSLEWLKYMAKVEGEVIAKKKREQGGRKFGKGQNKKG